MAKTGLLTLASISFIIVIGGATYEHAGVVPVWASAPLAMFQGEYALAASRFWIPIHPITLLLLLAALVINWRTERRNFILITIGGYLVVLVATFLIFVPELMSITQSAYGATVDPELTRRASAWEMMSLVRLGVLLVLAIILLYGLSRSSEPGRQ